MVKAGYVQDDRVVIPDSVKKMSKEELDRDIAQLEEESRKERERLSVKRNLAAV